MQQIRISAKNLGAVVLEDFCPRCFWLKLRMENRLPWQIFPGIFSSIDAYTKRVIHAQIDGQTRPRWMIDTMGDVCGYKKVPHFSKFKAEVQEFGILLTGTPDDIFICSSGAHIIPDYKTAKYTENQDRLLPMYRVQLNGYALIAEVCGFKPVDGLFLVYFEPLTDEEEARKRRTGSGFDMAFNAHPVKVEKDLGLLNEAMDMTRRIFGMPTPPDGREGCKDCECINVMMKACVND